MLVIPFLSYNQILIKNVLKHSNNFYLKIPHKKFLKVGMILSVKFMRNCFELYSYFFLGLLISIRNNNISSTFILRNVIALYPLEYTFFFYSPLVTLGLSFYTTRIVYKKNKYKFLRNKVAPLSYFPFKYIFYK